MITRTLTKVNEFIDVKMGFLGALFMASWVFWINFEHGIWETSIAASKQGFYTLFFGGLFLKMAENIATESTSRWKGIFRGATVPMLITSLLTLGLHSMKGTPEPVHSTIPTMVFSFLSFASWSWWKTRHANPA